MCGAHVLYKVPQASAEREVFHFCLFICAEIAANLRAEKLALVFMTIIEIAEVA